MKSQQAAHATSPWPEQIPQRLWDSAPAPKQAPPPQEVRLCFRGPEENPPLTRGVCSRTSAPSCTQHTRQALQGLLMGHLQHLRLLMRSCVDFPVMRYLIFHFIWNMQAGTWTTVWRTDALDSDGSLISGLAHVPGLPGLAGGDGHAGYLISAANQTLNLYECSASGGRGEASLQVPQSGPPSLRHSFYILALAAKLHR